MKGRIHPKSVIFVSVTGGLGGPPRSLATVLEHLDGSVERVLFAPSGRLVDFAKGRGSVERWVRMATGRFTPRVWRMLAGMRLIILVLAHRRRVLAIHANGQSELNLAAPAAAIARVPVVLWAHASQQSPSTRALGRVWARVVPELRLAAVSPEAQSVLESSGLVSAKRHVAIIPNPIDPAHVVAESTIARDTVTVGYLKGKSRVAGWLMLPEVIEALSDAQIRWLLFTSSPSGAMSSDIGTAWDRLRPMVGSHVEMRGKVASVADAYAECDIVFIPSLQESFSRIAVEAMLNRIPVVASDIPALRRLVGNDEAGLLFPVGDSIAAADQIRKLVTDPLLRRKLGDNGPGRGARFSPKPIVEELLRLYSGNSMSPDEEQPAYRTWAEGRPAE